MTLQVAVDPAVAVLATLAFAVGMNMALGARTNWGKSYAAQAYAERNMEDFDGVVLMDYKDEFTGLVECDAFDVKRLTVPDGAENIDAATWADTLAENRRVQLARAGATTEQFREAMANVTRALNGLDGRWFVVVDEAHHLAPQDTKCPDAFERLATTWHGDGLGVVYVTQRFAKLEETVLAECQASLLGGFRSTNDLAKIDSVEYPIEVHRSTADQVGDLPDALLVDGDPLALRRFEDQEGHTVGSEWVYTDSSTLTRLDSRDWEMESEHYGSDRVRINHPHE